jgi:hypothetical protein
MENDLDDGFYDDGYSEDAMDEHTVVEYFVYDSDKDGSIHKFLELGELNIFDYSVESVIEAMIDRARQDNETLISLYLPSEIVNF